MGAQEGPKGSPRRPQDDSKTTSFSTSIFGRIWMRKKRRPRGRDESRGVRGSALREEPRAAQPSPRPERHCRPMRLCATSAWRRRVAATTASQHRRELLSRGTRMCHKFGTVHSPRPDVFSFQEELFAKTVWLRAPWRGLHTRRRLKDGGTSGASHPRVHAPILPAPVCSRRAPAQLTWRDRGSPRLKRP